MATESANALDSRQKTSDAVTQESLILAYLKSGRTLTGIEALNKFSCFRLAARIHRLNQQGAGIKAEMVRMLDGARVARYYVERS